MNFPEHLNPHNSPDEVALAIFQTNAVSAGQNVGIFPRMARLNHGCSSAFNVVYTWREDEGGYLIVHALKNIPKGRVSIFLESDYLVFIEKYRSCLPHTPIQSDHAMNAGM